MTKLAFGGLHRVAVAGVAAMIANAFLQRSGRSVLREPSAVVG